ncbi:hypothetical protein L596_019041 [Steinernema carpocapsae]|uniref:Uncharacterized protein n=1 Tax=Steinernema carpocapsae TaxID=34508 RepID=A0A4U5N847_STECR|nr:hypothetical protein L596_019041 [Steinernema carpocapsae]
MSLAQRATIFRPQNAKTPNGQNGLAWSLRENPNRAPRTVLGQPQLTPHRPPPYKMGAASDRRRLIFVPGSCSQM